MQLLSGLLIHNSCNYFPTCTRIHVITYTNLWFFTIIFFFLLSCLLLYIWCLFCDFQSLAIYYMMWIQRLHYYVYAWFHKYIANTYIMYLRNHAIIDISASWSSLKLLVVLQNYVRLIVCTIVWWTFEQAGVQRRPLTTTPSCISNNAHLSVCDGAASKKGLWWRSPGRLVERARGATLLSRGWGGH